MSQAFDDLKVSVDASRAEADAANARVAQRLADLTTQIAALQSGTVTDQQLVDLKATVDATKAAVSTIGV